MSTPTSDQETPVQQQDPAGDPTPGPSPAQPDWKQRYDGQQAILQKRTEELNATKAQLHDLNTVVEDLRSQLTAATTGKQEIEQQLQSISAELSKVQQETAKMQLIREKYPSLLRFDPNILPSGEGDELDAALAAFNDTVTGLVNDATQAYRAQIAQGAVPAAPSSASSPSASGPSLADAYSKAMDAAGTPEFKDLWSRYIKLQHQADEKSGAVERYSVKEEDDFGNIGPDVTDAL